MKALLSHKVPDGDLAAALREAIRCGVERHGKRKGATAPAAKRRGGSCAADSRAAGDGEGSRGTRIPAAVRREVWTRDRGSCTWKAEDGRRCGSRWQLEVDHIQPPLLGGSSQADNLRLLCRRHNLLHAEQTYGRDHMERFRRTTVPVARDGAEVQWAGGCAAA